MGITAQSLDMMNRNNAFRTGTKMLELGCQNIYAQPPHFPAYEHWKRNESSPLPKIVKYGMIAKDYFQAIGIDHTSIDICGCQKSTTFDLRDEFPSQWLNAFDVITNYGTCEHIEGREGFWQGFKNIHDACKKEGLMFHRIPKTGNWKGHGHHYATIMFFSVLAASNGYALLELGDHPAMGNTKDGWVVYSVLRKMQEKEFMPLDEFLQLDIRDN
jgi:hypothetical protein